MNTKTVYETGATSHAVNDLILFTDNTRELAELRDKCYLQRIKLKGRISVWDFNNLIIEAQKRYVSLFPTSSSHISKMSQPQMVEYAQLYANDFQNWKKENGY